MAGTLLLDVKDASVRFGDKPLFEGLSFPIRAGEKICLVGKNGAGKTTLMNIITGKCDLDAGERWLLQGTHIGYLQQEITPRPGQTVRDFIFEALKNKDGSHDYKIEKVLEPMHLHPDDHLDSLSGGQLRRTALARALVEDPDILLLDEPTNHMDLDVIEWLEGFLRSWRGAVICVSHDRRFLENFTDRIFWLDRGRLRICPRGYAAFDEWAQLLLEQEERELHNRQKILDMEVDWASRGVKARRKRNVRRLDLMKAERDRLKSDKRALERMLAKIQLTPGEEIEASSRLVANFYNVGKVFSGVTGDKTILDKFHLRIQRGDRIGIIGKNGAGKTTFLKLLLGELAPDTGSVKRAKDLPFSYFDQTRKDLKPTHTLHQVLSPSGSDYIDVMGKPRHVYGYLKDFLFDPRLAQHPVSTLSGGQKNRLLLARILANPGALLILDEPTNDLDMDTLDRLEDMLMAYKGTLLVVSHDRDFLDQTVSKILAFEGDGQVRAVIGGYQDYLAQRRASAEPAADKRAEANDKPSAASDKVEKTPEKRLSYKIQYELDGLPARIDALGSEIVDLEDKLADHDLYVTDAAAFDRYSTRLQKARQALEQAETRWLELEEMRAAL